MSETQAPQSHDAARARRRERIAAMTAEERLCEALRLHDELLALRRDHEGGLPVDLPHLIALKLWTGDSKSVSDVVALLEANPDADLVAIDDVCARFDLSNAWHPLRPNR